VRRRLTIAMVLMVFGALVLAGLASLALVVHNTGVQTRRELVLEGQGLALTVQTQAANQVDPGRAMRNLLLVLKSPLRLEGSAVVAVTPGGALFDPATPRVTPTLPSGLDRADLNPPALLAGLTVSGTKGGVVYAAVPYHAEVQINGAPRQVLQVMVLARRPPSALAGAGRWFALSSLVILIVAVIVAGRLGRRFVRPLEAAQDVTSRIAGGDLDGRVPTPPGTDAELAALAGSINAMAESLARAKGAERQFLLSVSHDLRTPLTSIRGFAEAIEDGAAADVVTAAGVIASEARRLERLVADLLSLASLEARRFTLQLQPLDLATMAASTAAAFTPAAAGMGLSLAVDTAQPGAVEVTADPDRLAQVTANLIENALRYAAHEVRVSISNGGGGPELWVSDDGPGIGADEVALVFERPFMTRSRPDRPIGSGLGLAIVAELVSAMGGSVRAESPLGPQGGTRMVVTLPPSPSPSLSRSGP
jgi:signal transduction histidine kinase